MQVPDAIYFMMRDNPLTICNLSSNVITKIPAKFPIKFSLITGTFKEQKTFKINGGNSPFQTMPAKQLRHFFGLRKKLESSM